MVLDKMGLRVVIRYCWKRGLSTREATREINDAEGEKTVSQQTVSRWFKSFKSGSMNLNDQNRSGRPCVLEEEELSDALQKEPSRSTRDLAKELLVSQRTVTNYLHKFDFVHKKPRQDPHELTEAQATRRIEICRHLLENPLDDRFWKRIVTCDEKWVFLVNHDRSKRWVRRDQTPPPVPRRNRFSKKVMISVWWNVDGILQFELIPKGHAVTADLYSEQLGRVYETLKQKYPKLISRKQALLLHDNAKPHTAKKTKEMLEEMDGLEVLPHPPYSPDLAPSDYGLFRSMEHFLRGQKFESLDSLEEACKAFFDSKEPQWYRDQIRQLACRWQNVIENDGLYFD